MSKHNRERRRVKKIMLHEQGKDAPIYSEETLRRIAKLQGQEGINRVGIFHEWFCANALRKGAKKCVCRPEIRFIAGHQIMPDGRRKAVEFTDNEMN